MNVCLVNQIEQTSPDGDKMTTSKSQIQRFFAGKSIFITGSTGFLGSVLLEKLLRCCPDIKRVYLLIREKKGVDIQQRFKTLVNTKVSRFNFRNQNRKFFFSVLVPVLTLVTLLGCFYFYFSTAQNWD